MADKPQTPAGGVPGIDPATGHMDSRWDDPADDPEPYSPETSEVDQGRTFTQEELERQIGLRLSRERAKYADYQQLKEKATKFEELQEASQSELEKAVTKARKEERAKAVEEYETERRANRLQVAVANHARELADVDDVVMNLRGTDTNVFTDEGQIDDQAFGTALTDLLERKPHLRAGGQVPTGSADAGLGASSATLPPEQQHNQDLLGALGLKRT